VVSPPPVLAYTCRSEICAAGQPVFAVTFSRTYRAVAAEKVIVTVLAEAGSKV
jgi:hypothetical protein